MALRHCAAAAVFAAAVVVQVAADSWPGARPITLFTESASRFIRIVPGNSIGDVVGFGRSPKGPYARAEIYVRQSDRSYRLLREVTLVNPVAPVNALLAEEGAFVTFDNWHNLGYGPVVAIYAPDGTRIRDYRLEELYSADKIASLPTSVSSRTWRCAPHHFTAPDNAEVYVPDYFGGYFVFRLKDGSFTYTAPKANRASCTPMPPQGDR